MALNEFWIIGATLLGPILAVQAQKLVEMARERRTRKLWVFQTLMATRAARLSIDHVQALNMITLTFYGSRFLWRHNRTSKEQSVLDAWREYQDLLSENVDDASRGVWAAKTEELFVNLLFLMASELGFVFDRVELKKGAYSPIAHGNLEFQQEQIRNLAVDVLSGQKQLNVRLCEPTVKSGVLGK